MGKMSDPRSRILETLKGQKLVIPDLYSLYPEWKGSLNPYYKEVREQLEEYWLSRYVKDERERKKQKKVDAALLSGYFYPNAPLDKYQSLAEFFAWFFLWDDEIDCGSLVHERQKTEDYRRNTISYLKYCFEPDFCGNVDPVVGLHNSECFYSIGKNLQSGQSHEALLRYADSMYAYVNAVCSHQEERETELPTMESYVSRRTYTIGAYPCIFILEWAYGLRIPSWVFDLEETQIIMKETTLSNLLINDILSFKKEVGENEVHSSIPILMNEHHISAQMAIDKVVDLLKDSYDKFIAAELSLFNHPLIHGSLRNDVKTLVQGCKDITLGNVFWSYATDRYIPRDCFEGNQVTIQL